jgi:hypothetical protein
VRNAARRRATTRHEDCGGFPLSALLIDGIAKACHKIDVAGDGPYWGSGTLTVVLGTSELDGLWVAQVWDPGGGSYGRMSVSLNLGVHLRSQ